MESKSIALIGAGNLATSLGVSLALAGNTPVAVWSRTEMSARTLGERLGCAFCNNIEDLPFADIFIISVTDAAIKNIAAIIAQKYSSSLVVHTAGSVSAAILKEAGIKRYGVFYPMQTFTRSRVADFSKITIFVEAWNDDDTQLLERVARTLTSKVVRASSEQRKYLHIAAVFACNFTNAAYSMAATLLEENGLSFEAMLPLIEETAAKVCKIHPDDAQTGPASRGDEEVMNAHKDMLDGELKEIYSLLSDYISKKRDKKL